MLSNLYIIIMLSNPPPVATTAIWRLINTLGVKISVQAKVFKLADPVIELQFKNEFGGVCMFGQGIYMYGCENRK